MPGPYQDQSMKVCEQISCVIIRLSRWNAVYSATTLTKATEQNFPQIKQINIVEVNNGFPKTYPK